MTAALLAGVRSVIVSARRWIHLTQEPTGTWTDFRIGVGGCSDEWVTAYVCDVLERWRAGYDDSSAALARAALRRLQRRDGGWGYNQRIPSDADTTGFAVLALCRGQAQFDRAASMEFLLSTHDKDAGGFRTYRSPTELALLYRNHPVRATQSFEGWCSSHAEVTASALEALFTLGDEDSEQVRTATAYLLSMQNENGCWTGYWTTDFYYPTCRVVRALTRLQLGRKIAWVPLVNAFIGQQRCDGSWSAKDTDYGCPLRTALAIETLSCAPVLHLDAIEKAVRWLDNDRNPEGHWICRDPFLRVPPPNVTDPDEYEGWAEDGSGLGTIYADHRGILTTATVVSALEALHHRIASTVSY